MLVAVGNRNSFSKSVTHRAIVHVHVGVLCRSVDGVGRIDLRGNILVDSLDFVHSKRRKIGIDSWPAAIFEL